MIKLEVKRSPENLNYVRVSFETEASVLKALKVFIRNVYQDVPEEGLYLAERNYLLTEKDSTRWWVEFVVKDREGRERFLTKEMIGKIRSFFEKEIEEFEKEITE